MSLYEHGIYGYIKSVGLELSVFGIIKDNILKDYNNV